LSWILVRLESLFVIPFAASFRLIPSYSCHPNPYPPMSNNDTHAFTAAELESICKIIADTSEGLSGSEIGHLLQDTHIPDPNPTMTKWKWLYNALVGMQYRDQKGNCVLSFISKGMAPARYVGKKELFEERREKLNQILAFHGLKFREDGQFGRGVAAKTLTEAEERVERLRTKLEARGTHQDAIRYCSVLLNHNNHFHAVLEATKSVAEKIRVRSVATGDGASLIDAVFGGTSPLLRINNLVSETDVGEQKGFMNLLKGMFGTFRNPTAHAPQIVWQMSEEDALDLFAMVSYAHRRIDRAMQ